MDAGNKLIKNVSGIKLTGTNIYQSLNNSLTIIYGGNATNGAGAIFAVYGNGLNAGSFVAYVPNAAKNGYAQIFNIAGNTDTPYLDMVTRYITNVGGIILSGRLISQATDDQYTIMSGGTTLNGAPYFQSTGRNFSSAGAAGNAYVVVQKADKTTLVALSSWVGGTDTPYMSMNNYQIKDLATPTLSTDAVTKGYSDGTWTTWAPTYSWSSTTPTTITTNARYKTDGKTVFIQFQVNGTMAGTASNLLTISLPVQASASIPPLTPLTGVLNYGTSPLYAPIYPVVVPSATTIAIQIPAGQGPPIASQVYRYSIEGFYESV
jgi:hypothetical protein